jgi:hypothetical protein
MSSYFQSIRRLKDAQFYINEITRQFAVWKATQDQVDNPAFKAYQRATTNRLICKEQAAVPIQQDAEFWQPQVPQEPDGGILTPPGNQAITVMLNFDHELEDRSNMNNDALFEFTNNQLIFTEGATSALSFAIDFNHNSNVTYDKLWIPFSNSTQIVYDTPTGFSIFTRIKPTVVADLGTSTTPGPAPASNRLKDFGGPKRNHVDQQLYVIWWGNGWNDNGNDEDDKNTLKSHYNQIVASDYFRGLWQYNDTKPIATITHVDNTTFSVPGSSAITFQQVVDCIFDSQDEGNVPPFTSTLDSGWNFDLTHLYLVMIPPNKLMPQGYGGATSRHQRPGNPTWFNWCATYGPAAGYGTLPGGSQIQTVEQGAMHELIHAYLTPTVAGCVNHGGWLFDEPGFCNNSQHGPPGTGCGFFADQCNCGNRLRSLSGTNIMVESYWSNMDGRCIAPGTGDAWTRPSANPPTPTNPSIRRYIFQKMDDLDNGATAAIDSNGIIYFNVKKNAIEYKVKTLSGALVVGQWADLWFAFDNPTNKPRIFVNNVLYTTPSTEVLLWNNTHSHTIIGNYNMGATVGQLRAAMDDFRLYRNGVVTSDQVDNLSNNGLTVTNIDVTQERGVAIVNRTRLNKQLENTGVFVGADAEAGDVAAAKVSFTSDCFTSTCFTT